MPREWDAATYDRIPMPHLHWGAGAIARLELKGNERVLDAGCGTGRVTQQLLERLPEGRVVAVDGSRAMLDQLQERLAPSMARVQIVFADLTEPLPLEEPVDAILSTATFHWLPDHAALFQHLAAVLKPGGRLVAECGGKGNIDRVVEALRELGLDKPGIWNFAGPQETEARLRSAGFVDVNAWLTRDPAVFPSGAPFETYLETVVLGAHLAHVPDDERRALIRRIA